MKILNKIVEDYKNNNKVVAYHGTDYNFTEFKNPASPQNHYDENIYFTDNIKIAKKYGNNIIKVEIDTSELEVLDGDFQTYNEFYNENEGVFRNVWKGLIIENIYDLPEGNKKLKSMLGTTYVIPFHVVEDIVKPLRS